jgi:large subunit ribosomal protein L20
MPRVKKGAARAQGRKRRLLRNRGKFGSASKSPYIAEITEYRGGVFAYRSRRIRKRDMRGLWIVRITAACRMRNTRYSLFMNGLKNAGILLNRKMLSELAIRDPKTFDRVVEIALKASRAVPAKAA